MAFEVYLLGNGHPGVDSGRLSVAALVFVGVTASVGVGLIMAKNFARVLLILTFPAIGVLARLLMMENSVWVVVGPTSLLLLVAVALLRIPSASEYFGGPIFARSSNP